MADALSISLSGLMAQGQRLAATASNIANATTTGPLPTPRQPVSTVYKPLTVSYTALTAGSQPGGVSAAVIPDETGYEAVPDPDSPFANAQGLVAAPNIDLNQEIVNLIMTRTAYKANIAAIKTENQMTGDLIDTIT